MKGWQNIIKITIISGVLVFLIGMFLFGDGLQMPMQKTIKVFGIYLLYAFVMSLVNGYFFNYIRKVLPWETSSKKQLIYGFIGSLVLSTLVLVFLKYFIEVIIYNQDPSTFLKGSKTYFFFGISITIIIILMFYVFYFYKSVAQQKVNESQIVAKTETAKYESLKSQIDPHFLFNSLNVLTSLISENPERAEKFTTKLSKVYRYVLEQKNKDLIPLSEELEFAKTYMELLKMRFEDSIEFNISDKITNVEYKIVPLSLQLLLENAVKHNVINNEIPLAVNIYEENGFLVVSNNLNKKTSLSKGTKLGLNNIKERYNLITKKLVSVNQTKDEFVVKLPLLTQKIRKMKTNINEEAKYIKARKKVEEIKGFYSSLLSFFIVIPFLIFIWYRYTPNTIQWFWFPIFGWGFGLVVQGMGAFGKNPFFGNNWEERKIEELMKEDEKQYWE